MPYLDVAFLGDLDSIQGVDVVLRHVGGDDRRLALAFSNQDREWQRPSPDLGELAVGTHFVAEVVATTTHGTFRWASDAPWAPYRIDDRTLEVTPGFFCVGPPDGWWIRVDGPPDSKADPILAVFPEGEQTQWIAANDDARSDGPWSELQVALEPGRYWLRVTGAEDDAGWYSIRWGRQRFATDSVGGGAANSPDDPRHAVRLPPNTGITDRISGQGDVDWFVIEVPEKRAKSSGDSGPSP